MNIGEAVKERILELCNERDISINKLSSMSGVPQSTVNNIVSGRNRSATVSTYGQHQKRKLKKSLNGIPHIISFLENALIFNQSGLHYICCIYLSCNLVFFKMLYETIQITK